MTVPAMLLAEAVLVIGLPCRPKPSLPCRPKPAAGWPPVAAGADAKQRSGPTVQHSTAAPAAQSILLLAG